MLYLGNGDGIGLGWMGWLSEVIGSLRAPSVVTSDIFDLTAERNKDKSHQKTGCNAVTSMQKHL